ncbi:MULTISPECIES: hypothetical protein [Amycolatopsis]|uniref:Uncharacterized protein n=1 Tax=Amycolatopsis thermalba TaxID=944492 RepID=A0ABY4P3K6_9PSEU|nr:MULTISPECIES: hypothetical protein [Amycolatopsis]OXM71385.1 hypothetical protein CF166_19110 [Amycolatopsis sp. KNN50.9b]UQS26932.1 hypothetical protein L1857_31095 [Amycolatopsis thermalba]
MSHENTQRDVRRLAGRLVDDLGRQDLTAVSRALPRMIGADAPEAGLLRPLCAELVTVIAREVRARAAPEGADLFTVELSDEGDAGVPIDELQPPLRAVLRAVLAELNHDTDGVDAQLEFIAGDPDPCGQIDALIHLVSWAHDLPRT